MPSSGTKVTSEKLLLCEMLLIEIYPQSQYLLLDKPSCFPQSFSPDHLLVYILVHQSDPLNLAPVSSPSSHLLSSSLGPCGARQVNARACLERSSFNVLRFFDTVLLKMQQFSTDQGYIREVTAVSEPLQSPPPITFTSLSLIHKVFLQKLRPPPCPRSPSPTLTLLFSMSLVSSSFCHFLSGKI